MQGKFADADEIFKRVLVIDIKSFGPEHPAVVDPEQPTVVYPEHPTVADDLNNRAAMSYSQVGLGTC